MYVYFNNEGALTTIIQHGDPVIRQGSDFKLYVLFETNCPYIVGSGNDEDYPFITIKFKKNGEDRFGEEKPLTLYNSEYNFTKLNNDEITFDLSNKTYICYKYDGDSYDSSKYGSLYGVVTVYAPLENVVLTDNTIVGDAVPRSVITTGLLTTYVEKTTGTATVPSVNAEQYSYLMTLIGMVWNRIVGGDGSINIGVLRGHSEQKRVDVDSDLIPLTDNTYDLGSSAKAWAELYLKSKLNYQSTHLTVKADGDTFIIKWDNNPLLELSSTGGTYYLKLNNEDITSTVADLHTKIYGNNSTTGIIPLLFGSLDNYIHYNKAPFETRVGRLENAVGDVANYPNNKGTLMNRMNTTEGDIDSLEGRVGTAEGDIDSLEERATALETEVGTQSNPSANSLRGRVGILEGQRPGYIKLLSTSGTLTDAQKLELSQPDCVIEYDNNYYQWTIKGTVNKFTYVQRYNPSSTPNVFVIKTIEINSSYQYSMSDTTYNILGTNMVEDNVASDSSTKVLSAKQGKYLKGIIDDIINDIGAYTDVVSDGTIKSKLTYLQSQIDGINAGQNLVDIVADISALQNYDTTNLEVNDKVQVLTDINHNNASTVYNWNGSSWDYIGPYGQDSYQKSEVYTKQETEGVVNVERARILALETEIGAQNNPSANSLRGRMDSAESRLKALETFDSGLTAITNVEIESLFS